MSYKSRATSPEQARVKFGKLVIKNEHLSDPVRQAVADFLRARRNTRLLLGEGMLHGLAGAFVSTVVLGSPTSGVVLGTVSAAHKALLREQRLSKHGVDYSKMPNLYEIVLLAHKHGWVHEAHRKKYLLPTESQMKDFIVGIDNKGGLVLARRNLLRKAGASPSAAWPAD
ncbi:hypothetical protein AUJ14_05350 [Candidatus Micrarchaeota archaeon CG1_02_55_22]|nr:MAG: hypothetical protein AUJ14_05350 [Candidatus Micrarchaeota archaeon CG1_02_55_22]